MLESFYSTYKGLKLFHSARMRSAEISGFYSTHKGLKPAIEKHKTEAETVFTLPIRD